ncbi:MAG: chromosome partitioning protein ParA [Rickettsiaceae bacterium]|nr:MAG: chromosome partitioning protein ParA [Rickettsiaceae bacterium]
MLILIGGEKGGTGKSCLTQNLAVILQKIDANLLIIDCDPQKTTSDWIQERNNNSIKPHIECVQMYGNILNNLEKVKIKYETILIDCGGQDSKALRSSLVTCTHALFPIRPKRRDLKTIKHLEELVEEAKITNPNMKYSMLINQAPSLPSQYQRIIDAKNVCRDWELPCLNTVIFHRNIYDDSEERGLSVMELGIDNKATLELYSLIEEFLNVKIF